MPVALRAGGVLLGLLAAMKQNSSQSWGSPVCDSQHPTGPCWSSPGPQECCISTPASNLGLTGPPLPTGVPERGGHGHPPRQRLCLPRRRHLPPLRLPAGQGHRPWQGPPHGCHQDEQSPGRVPSARREGERLQARDAPASGSSLSPVSTAGGDITASGCLVSEASAAA